MEGGLSAAVCQESKTLEVAEEEEKRIEGAEEGEQGRGKGSRLQKGRISHADVRRLHRRQRRLSCHARDRTRINSDKYSMQMISSFREDTN